MNSTISKIETWRMWRENDDLDFGWLLTQFRKEEKPSEQQLAGLALHHALELAPREQETEFLRADGYRFAFLKDFSLELPPSREVAITKEYGELILHGRVDSIDGLIVTDYKTTKQFNPERLLEGYQWRYFLDMTGADIFRWKIFVLLAAGEEDGPYSGPDEELEELEVLRNLSRTYIVSEIHDLDERRYPALGEDCARLAADYLAFMKRHARTIYAKPDPEPSLEEKLKASVAAVKNRKRPQ